jgi:hypothetical protein
MGGIVAALLALEVLFRLLPVSTSTATGYYFDALILSYPAGQRFTLSTGWNLQRPHTHRANNFGFLADHDFVRNPHAVALIGDSFVEASMLPPADRLAAQLERRLGARQVYALGSPGTALLDYGERMRFAAERFGIHDFVLLLEHGDIAQALCGSGNVNARCLDRNSLEPRIEKLPPAGAFKRVLRNSALSQYLFSQLKLDPAAWLRSWHRTPTGGLPATRDLSEISARAIDRVLSEFFANTQAYRTGTLILILIASAPADAAAGDAVRDRLIDAARRNGAQVIEVGPALTAYEAQTGLSMHVAPRDAHLNRLALGLIADEVAPMLRDDSGAR